MEGKLYNLENIVAEVSKYCGSHTINEKFSDLCIHMGISPEVFKRNHYRDQSRYCFTEEGYKFWVEALRNITEEPYRSIRKNEMRKVPLEFIDKFMNMVKGCMSACGKNEHDINGALNQIDCTTQFCGRILAMRSQKAINQFIGEFTENFNKFSYLNTDDRRAIIELTASKILNQYLKSAVSDAEFYFDYLNDERIEEAGRIAQISNVDDLIGADRKFDELLQEQDCDAIVPKGKPGSLAYEGSMAQEIAKQKRRFGKMQEEIDKEENVSWDDRHKPEVIERRSALSILEEAEHEKTFGSDDNSCWNYETFRGPRSDLEMYLLDQHEPLT